MKYDVIIVGAGPGGIFAAYELMQAVNSPHFKMYWQPNQYKSEQKNIDYAKIVSPYTMHLHVFHWKGNDKFPLGEAIEMWRRYLSCFTGDRTLLLEFMPDGTLESLPRETLALKEIAKQ